MRQTLILLASLWFTWISPANAQVYPDYHEVYINDFARLLSQVDKERIRGKLRNLKEETGIEFTVVTLGSKETVGHHATIESLATGLFNHWGVGDPFRNDGIMMLVISEDRALRIEIGSGYTVTVDDTMKDLIEQDILPQFRSGDFTSGIEEGVDTIIYKLTDQWPDEQRQQRVPTNIEIFVNKIGAWFYVVLAPIFLVIVRIYRERQRNRPRACPRDGLLMVRLDEDLDDSHLENGQQTEEHLKSVDHDVWSCAKCDHVTIEAYKTWFSKCGACRSCGYRTVEGDTTILKFATTSSQGSKRIDYYCHHCNDAWSATHSIPRLSESSGPSSSS